MYVQSSYYMNARRVFLSSDAEKICPWYAQKQNLEYSWVYKYVYVGTVYFVSVCGKPIVIKSIDVTLDSFSIAGIKEKIPSLKIKRRHPARKTSVNNNKLDLAVVGMIRRNFGRRHEVKTAGIVYT